MLKEAYGAYKQLKSYQEFTTSDKEVVAYKTGLKFFMNLTINLANDLNSIQHLNPTNRHKDLILNFAKLFRSNDKSVVFINRTVEKEIADLNFSLTDNADLVSIFSIRADLQDGIKYITLGDFGKNSAFADFLVLPKIPKDGQSVLEHCLIDSDKIKITTPFNGDQIHWILYHDDGAEMTTKYKHIGVFNSPETNANLHVWGNLEGGKYKQRGNSRKKIKSPLLELKKVGALGF